VTNIATYVLSAGGLLQAFYHNSTYAPCLGYGIHTVTEKVRRMLSHLNKLISSEKKVLIQAPSRVAILGVKLPETQRPANSVLKRFEATQCCHASTKGTMNGFPAGYAHFI
jgi:hypothetical protein